MALSQTAWMAAGLGARLLMIAFLAMTVQLALANHTRLTHSDDWWKLPSYTYMVAAAVIGMACSVLLQLPVAVYLLFKSKRTTPSALLLDISLSADMVATVLLASGVGAGFGATDAALRHTRHARWDDGETRKDLIDYYDKAELPAVFLLIGMVLSMAATVASTRLRARATNDHADL
ncbi:hypothetical protein U9M48_001963 [Paspalum notatum var. saurae]|uniref:CASP-like protein n=1 Tax=Paspalum notatum var. saurae TaxID=547442 RepID=A0AAQ3PPH3_PASNO